MANEKVKFYQVNDPGQYQKLIQASQVDPTKGYLIFYQNGTDKKIWANGFEYNITNGGGGGGGINVNFVDSKEDMDLLNPNDGDICILKHTPKDSQYMALDVAPNWDQTGDDKPLIRDQIGLGDPDVSALISGTLTSVFIYSSSEGGWVKLKHSTSDTFFDTDITFNTNSAASNLNMTALSQQDIIKNGVYHTAGKSIDEVFYDLFTRRYKSAALVPKLPEVKTSCAQLTTQPQLNPTITFSKSGLIDLSNTSNIDVTIELLSSGIQGILTPGSLTMGGFTTPNHIWVNIDGTEDTRNGLTINSQNISVTPGLIEYDSNDSEIDGDDSNRYKLEITDSSFNDITEDTYYNSGAINESYSTSINEGANSITIEATGPYVGDIIDKTYAFDTNNLQWVEGNTNHTFQAAFYPENDTTENHGDIADMQVGSKTIGVCQSPAGKLTKTITGTVYGVWPIYTNGQTVVDEYKGSYTSNLSKIDLSYTYTDNGTYKSFDVAFDNQAAGPRFIKIPNNKTFTRNNMRTYNKVTSEWITPECIVEQYATDNTHTTYKLTFEDNGKRSFRITL